MSRLRISAISYLNTAPLMWDFENGETAELLQQHFQFSYTIPSECAEQLRSGEADIGIIPVAAYTTIPDLQIIPDVAIASKNKVRSILLVSKSPLETIRDVAVDTSSRTSTALLQVFLKKFVGVKAAFSPQKPDLAEMLRWHDAAMLIGDAALQARTGNYHVYDLAEEWRRWTGRPFVFAFWAIRKAALENAAGLRIAPFFQKSRDHGLQNVDSVAADWSARLGMTPKAIREYLTENIDYSLDRDNLEGLQLFYRYAADCEVLPAAPPLRFLDQRESASRTSGVREIS